MGKQVIYLEPKGCEPRLWTRPLRPLTPKTTKGYAVIRFARRLGVRLMPWQKWVLIHALELNPDCTYRFRTVLVLVARQNGKTTILKVLSLWRLLEDHARLVLGTSTNLDYAIEAWDGAVELAEERFPDDIAQIRRTNGQNTLRLANGGRYKVAASSRKGGRSLSVDLGILDELREHKTTDSYGAISGATVARPDSQLWALSNMGDDESVVLNDLRAKAIAYIDASEGDSSLGLFEYSGADGCALDDPEATRLANPALGHTITEATLASKRATCTPEVYRTEHLCQHVPTMDSAIDLVAFEACSDPGTMDDVRDRVAWCLDVSPDLAHVTVAAAAVQDDGKARVEIVAAWETTDAARQELPALLDRAKPRVCGWLPGGPGASLAADFRGREGMQEIRAEDVTAACMAFAEQVIARRVAHSNDPLLTAQVSAASKRAVGDSWVYTRRGSAGHVDAVYATAGALHLARTLPPPSRPLKVWTIPIGEDEDAA
jgi:hypothetical protein